ncbi:hypothetical protein V7111_09625 [Neobacillus niacini]|uniref:hypothetical protein n=1 Tax=Neobacillus niacini TaxID=86668 RepID=UPI002FFDCF22
MARLPMVKEEDMSKDLQNLLKLSKERGAPKQTLFYFMSHAQEVTKSVGDLWNAAFFDGVVEHTIKEYVRLRIAFHYGCPF